MQYWALRYRLLTLGATVTMYYCTFIMHMMQQKYLFAGLVLFEIYANDLSDCSRLQTSI